MLSTENLIKKSKIAEQAERYEDMVKYMKLAVQQMGNERLSSEHRNLLSVAYKNVVGSKRSAWRIISASEQKKKDKGEDPTIDSEYRTEIEEGLKVKCEEVVKFIEDYLASRGDNADGEELVFFYKMKGDYLRYMVEVEVDDVREARAKSSEEAYEKATSHAKEELSSTDPIRLGLALNFSVFYYEIRNLPDKACELAKNAFDSAISELDKIKDDSYKDSTLIMQLLRDNLTLWTSEQEQDQEKDV